MFSSVPFIPSMRYDLCIRLLAIFAEHLPLVASQLALQGTDTESVPVTRARAYYLHHQSEKMSLGAIAKAASTSPCHFCKVFEREPGVTLSDYIAFVRCESVKVDLLNLRTRVCDAAYDAGFQSLSQFNRVFRRITGLAPKNYRLLNAS